jgi:acyl-CoA thioester hydrolase
MDRVKRATGHSAGATRDISCKPETGPGARFTWNVRVYYEDTDLGGVVYHANYLRFMERARTEWLRSLGFEQDALRDHHGMLFVVVEAEVAFRRPARFNDELTVSVEVRRSGRASLGFHQEVQGASAGHELFCMGDIRVACIDADTFKPRILPQDILRELVE